MKEAETKDGNVLCVTTHQMYHWDFIVFMCVCARTCACHAGSLVVTIPGAHVINRLLWSHQVHPNHRGISLLVYLISKLALKR